MKSRQHTTMIVVFLFPAVLAYVLIYLYPTLRTGVMSFFQVDTITTSIAGWRFIGMGNYVFLFESPLFLRSIRNIAFFWFAGAIMAFFFALLFAVVLTSGVRGKSFFKAVIYLPNVISAVAMGTMWTQYVYSARYGLLKNLFTFLGLEELAAIQWTSPDFVSWALLIAYTFGMIGYFMLIFIAAIEKIPQDYFEAATIEGANKIRQFFTITLPLIKNVFRTNIVLWTVSTTTVGFFIWVQVFSPRLIEQGTVTPMVYMYQSIFGAEMVVTARNVGAGAAIGVILSLMVLGVFLVTAKFLKDDKTEF